MQREREPSRYLGSIVFSGSLVGNARRCSLFQKEAFDGQIKLRADHHAHELGDLDQLSAQVTQASEVGRPTSVATSRGRGEDLLRGLHEVERRTKVVRLEQRLDRRLRRVHRRDQIQLKTTHDRSAECTLLHSQNAWAINAIEQNRKPGFDIAILAREWRQTPQVGINNS